MSKLKTHALREFATAGWMNADGTFKDEMQQAMCNHVLELLSVFSSESHSGSSAQYAISLFKKLASFEPITPLTGADDEWEDVGHYLSNSDVRVYQNRRMSSVFKQGDRFKGRPYWIEGKVFWEWESHPDIDNGAPYKSYYTNSKSVVPIRFPWTKPENPEYVFVPTEKFPNEVLYNSTF